MRNYQNPCGMSPAVVNNTTPVVNTIRRVIDTEYPIAMAYVPWQRWCETYDAAAALCKGTLFPELDLPLTGCCERRNCCG